MYTKTTMKAFCTKSVTICLFLLMFNSLHAQINSDTPKEETLYHVLLFKWKAGTTIDQIEGIKTLWKGLVSKVDGFNSFEMKDVITGNFNHVVILQFSSTEAMETYASHDDHEKLAEIGPTIVAEFSEYDYWD